MNKYAIACNTTNATAVYAAGAKAYLCHFAGDRARVLVRSRSGRYVDTWVKVADLRSFRRKNIPPDHPLYDRIWEVGEFMEDEQIEELNTLQP